MSRVELEMVGQLFLAAVLSGLLGWERQRRGQPAGLRTYMLVSVASASFTQVGAYAFQTTGLPHDPMRVAAQVVTGVGFLGAGAIWRTGTAPRGLTTAAGLWVSAAVGMLSAAAFYGVAIAATVLAWIILRGGWELERQLGVKRDQIAETSEEKRAEDNNYDDGAS